MLCPSTMDDVIVVESEDSESSIVELEVPKKPTPPLINLEEEIILNIMQSKHENIVAKDFIERDKAFSQESKKTEIPQYLNSPNHWTRDMIKFYDDDWGNEEHFIVEKIQEKMDKTPSLWTVSKKDMLSTRNKINRSNIRCWNCKQIGHHFLCCPDPPHVPKCHMCGSEGHLEYSCPHSICLNCGQHSKEYVTCCYKCRRQQNEMCSRCRTVGHNFINCPDHWRLFHLTTVTTSVVIPDRDIYKPGRDIWCCNCGKKGHHHIQCKKKKTFSAFMDTLPFVFSYQKAFNDADGISAEKQEKHEKCDNRLERILQSSKMHKVINKHRHNLKNKFSKLKKIKRNKKKKKRENQGALGPLT